MLEVCCGSYYDALQAYKGGAKRIELNCGLYLGGLTPSLATLTLTKEHCPGMSVIAMVRPRGGGFCYSKEDFLVMEEDCKQLLRHGADGIAFGCLLEDGSLDIERNSRIIDYIHTAGGEAVFHRAFDCSKDPFKSIEDLIVMKVDRLLTSGLKPTAIAGKELIKTLQEMYGQQIQILPGSGINVHNASSLMAFTGVSQIHSSCKDWVEDPTTQMGDVTFGYANEPFHVHNEVVSTRKVQEILEVMGE